MRWLTLPPREREPVLQAIDAFWLAFAERSERIDALFRMADRWDLVTWLNGELAKVTPGLLWEFGPGANGHHFVITPEDARTRRALVDTLIARAPELPGWSFGAARPPAGPEIAANFAENRAGVKLAGALLSVAAADDNRIDVRWHIPDASGQRGFEAALIATERLLGQRMLDDWVGHIDCVESVDGMRTWETLPVLFHAARNRVLNALPALPFHAQDYAQTPSAMWKNENPGEDDFVVARSTHPVMWKAARASDMFVSERFSRHGERFGFVRLPHLAKYDLEDALLEKLQAAKMGSVTGGSAGKAHSTIDIVLSNVAQGIEIVRSLSPAEGAFQFHDPALAEEGFQ